MIRAVWLKRWWGPGAAFAAALLVLTPSGSFLFDRNYDGADDGGPDVCIWPAAALPIYLVIGLVLLSGTVASIVFHPSSSCCLAHLRTTYSQPSLSSQFKLPLTPCELLPAP